MLGVKIFIIHAFVTFAFHMTIGKSYIGKFAVLEPHTFAFVVAFGVAVATPGYSPVVVVCTQITAFK